MSALNIAGRRGFLRLLGLAPVALPVGAKEVAASLLTKIGPIEKIGTAMLGVSRLGESAPGGVDVADRADTLFGGLIGQQIRDVKAHMEMENWILQRLAVDGLDADIACIRSTSRTHKVRKQIERIREREAVARSIYKIFYPKA